MIERNQAYHIMKGVFAVLFAAGGLITIPSLSFSFASPSSDNVDEGGAKMHLDEAMKALQAGDTAGAEMHVKAAQDNL